jgi:hypothetical protein
LEVLENDIAVASVPQGANAIIYNANPT